MDKYRERASGQAVEAYQIEKTRPLPEWAGSAIVFTLDDCEDGKVDIRTPYGPACIFPGDWLVYRPSDKSYGGYSDGGFHHFFEKVEDKPVRVNQISTQIKNFLTADVPMSAQAVFRLLRASSSEIDRLTKALAESKQ